MLTRQKWVIIAVTLAGAVLGLALTAFSAKVYEGTALLSVESSANDATILETGAASRSQALTYTAQVNDRGFLAAAAASLGGGLTATSLDQRVNASVVKDTELIRIAATGASPRDAQDLAQRFADFSVSFFEDQAQRRGAASRRELEAQLEALNTEIDKLGRAATRGARRGRRRDRGGPAGADRAAHGVALRDQPPDRRELPEQRQPHRRRLALDAGHRRAGPDQTATRLQRRRGHRLRRAHGPAAGLAARPARPHRALSGRRRAHRRPAGAGDRADHARRARLADGPVRERLRRAARQPDAGGSEDAGQGHRRARQGTRARARRSRPRGSPRRWRAAAGGSSSWTPTCAAAASRTASTWRRRTASPRSCTTASRPTP